MKALVVLSALLAVAVAKPGFLAGGIPGAYAPAAYAPAYAAVPPGGSANIVIGPGGVPVDTPAVAAARGAHLAAVAQTQARDAAANAADAAAAAAGAAFGYAPAVGYAAAAPAVVAPSLGYARYGPANIVIGPGGVPLDTPEVAAAKAANAAAHLEAKARAGIFHG
ncbi:cuticle protein 18.7-like [Schistocerca serialis cubense]|uniref:cuticle protein 18.7-like n=1 Tax=Schistocerca serialis cubense TaxID=2023355 RepID=UPI00214DF9B0|nr:cuticle protein 18.7-like [Schistocerca serialis cubense]